MVMEDSDGNDVMCYGSRGGELRLLKNDSTVYIEQNIPKNGIAQIKRRVYLPANFAMTMFYFGFS